MKTINTEAIMKFFLMSIIQYIMENHQNKREEYFLLNPQSEREMLLNQLKTAVDSENFEAAAEIKKQLDKLK